MYGNLCNFYTLTITKRSFKQFPIMSKNLTKREIVQKIYESHNFNHKDVTDIVQKTLDCIMDGLTKGKMSSFETSEFLNCKFGSKEWGNPNRPETDVVIPRRAVVKFKAGKEMKVGLGKLDLDQL